MRIGKPRIKTRDVNSGVLGPRFESFKIDEPGKLPDDVHPAVAPDVLQRRLALAGKARRAVRRPRLASRRPPSSAKSTTAPAASSSARCSSAFDLDKEPEKLRDAYGRNAFGQGCLLARRLVESGRELRRSDQRRHAERPGWDTHKRGFKENPILAGETDSGYATLLTDLADRGMLDNTLVVWMGEFCRTPKYEDDAAAATTTAKAGWSASPAAA